METLLKETQAYRLLEKDCRENTFSHAYLLQFEDRKNLKIALKAFAKLFFMEEISQDSGRIERLIDKESFSDCLFFPSEGKKLSVEDAERIKEESLLSPLESQRKLFVLGDFSEANAQTQNKLLKLLEEPPENVVFLLGATTSFSVLTTVLSRTKKLEILPFSMEEVTACLARIYKDEYTMDALKLCSATSGGIVGEAQNVLEGGYYKALLDGAFDLALSDEHRLGQVVKTVGEPNYKKELLSLLRLIFRDALLVKTANAACKKALLLKAEKDKIEKVAEKYTISALLYAQEALSSAELQVQFNAVFPQCIEICIANIREKNK